MSYEIIAEAVGFVLGMICIGTVAGVVALNEWSRARTVRVKLAWSAVLMVLGVHLVHGGAVFYAYINTSQRVTIAAADAEAARAQATTLAVASQTAVDSISAELEQLAAVVKEQRETRRVTRAAVPMYPGRGSQLLQKLEQRSALRQIQHTLP